MHNREAFPCNSNAFDALEWRKPILNSVVEALSDPNTHLIGVYGSHDEIKDTLLQRVRRRVQRDQLFDMVVTAAVTKYPDMRKIQEDIASQLGLTFIHVSKDKRAIELMHRVKNEQKILVVLCNLHKGLDLGKLGIPYGADHTGCKILLSSTSEDVLSNRMHTHDKMCAVVAIIAGIIDLAAISLSLLRHYPTSSKSQTHKPQSLQKKETEQLRELHCYVMEDMIPRIPTMELQANLSNSNTFDALEWRKPILGNVMEALADLILI
ncbi:disease resistance protein SUMM2-like [Prosopis cineraria]|uniref:disease resistance protein SUMM2-like n=1 Tax=Prosopis cineraria TaxID=364024 RepID=UPI002410006A|nr:disease resistance protein SUMM2-like [Prosopis cineraria]